MGVIYYMISEASKLVHVETHVLRYWEEELGLEVDRNELGHRVYSKEDIRLFNVIRILKEKGYQLKAIKELLPHLRKMDESEVSSFQEIRLEACVDESGFFTSERGCSKGDVINTDLSHNPLEKAEIARDNTSKEDIEELLSDIVYRALERYELSHPVQENVPVELSEKSLRDLVERIESVMSKKEEREEERLRLLDEYIRDLQKVNKEQRRKGIGFLFRGFV